MTGWKFTLKDWLLDDGARADVTVYSRSRPPSAARGEAEECEFPEAVAEAFRRHEDVSAASFRGRGGWRVLHTVLTDGEGRVVARHERVA